MVVAAGQEAEAMAAAVRVRGAEAMDFIELPLCVPEAFVDIRL